MKTIEKRSNKLTSKTACTHHFNKGSDGFGPNIICVEEEGRREAELTLLSPDYRSSYTSGKAFACLVMGRDLTCNKALLLCITPSGCPPQRFCTCEPQWLMYVLFSSPHWRSFFSLFPLLAFIWWTPEGPNQREGICIRSLASLHARSRAVLCSPSVNHNYFRSRSTLLNVSLSFSISQW